jgi:hypothetical protein
MVRVGQLSDCRVGSESCQVGHVGCWLLAVISHYRINQSVCMRLLLEHGANIDAENNKGESRPHSK